MISDTEATFYIEGIERGYGGERKRACGKVRKLGETVISRNVILDKCLKFLI